MGKPRPIEAETMQNSGQSKVRTPEKHNDTAYSELIGSMSGAVDSAILEGPNAKVQEEAYL